MTVLFLLGLSEGAHAQSVGWQPVPVSRDTPPTFLLQAQDDHTDGVNQSLVYYSALKKAGVPAEMHIYAGGGHAFGLRRSKFPITQWPRLAEVWLRSIGMIPSTDG